MVSWKFTLIMRIDIITCLPEIFDGPMTQSIVKELKKGLIKYIQDLRPFLTINKNLLMIMHMEEEQEWS